MPVHKKFGKTEAVYDNFSVCFQFGVGMIMSFGVGDELIFSPIEIKILAAQVEAVPSRAGDAYNEFDEPSDIALKMWVECYVTAQRRGMIK